MRSNPEYTLQKQLAAYLRLQYPRVLFRSDAAGLNLSKAQAGMNKAIQYGRGWPDLFIAEPMLRDGKMLYAGLFLELKAEGTPIIRSKDASKPLKGEAVLRRKGDFFDAHIQEQAEMLLKLAGRGYLCKFAVGFNQAKAFIDAYLDEEVNIFDNVEWQRKNIL